MDKWTKPQMERMLKGGNQKCREFFEGQGEKWKSENLVEKYNTHTAAMYRDKVSNALSLSSLCRPSLTVGPRW